MTDTTTTTSTEWMRRSLEDARLALDFIDEHQTVFANTNIYLDRHNGGTLTEAVLEVNVMLSPHDFDDVTETLIEKMADIARCLAQGAPFGSVRKEYKGDYFRMYREFGSGAARIEAWATREDVCELRVIGKELVQEADPDAPKITVEREITEWVCSPLLSADA